MFTTRVFRHTDRQPLANYRVRYKILDGPAAVLLPSRTTEYTAISDLSGNAQVAIAQAAPAFGRNRVSVEVIRPPDPTAPSGSGIVIARGETSIDWLAPNVSLTLNGPPSAVVGQEAAYSLVIGNSGRIESKSQQVTIRVPDGMEYVRSQPPAFLQGGGLIWTLGQLAPEQAQTSRGVQGDPAGRFHRGRRHANRGRTERREDGAPQVMAAALKVEVTGPATAAVGAPITYKITVRNPGNGPLDNVELTAQLDDGLEHASKARTLNLKVPRLEAQQSKTEQLVATPRKMGPLAIKVLATAGTLTDQAQHVVNVQQAAMSLSIDGPKVRYKGKTADYAIRVSNPSDTPLTTLWCATSCPPSWSSSARTTVGKPAAARSSGILGTLAPREEKTLTLPHWPRS